MIEFGDAVRDPMQYRLDAVIRKRMRRVRSLWNHATEGTAGGSGFRPHERERGIAAMKSDASRTPHWGSEALRGEV